MKLICPNCSITEPRGPKIIRYGTYYRTSDSQRVQRFQCLKCQSGFSRATLHPCFRQKKRNKNESLRKLLCSGVSQRRASEILKIHRTTVVRKFLHLAIQAEQRLIRAAYASPPASEIEFDDMETFESTKCKPISITLAVESSTRRILSLEVSSIAAKGTLARISKYGPRPDGRSRARVNLFERLKDLVDQRAVIRSDRNPFYKKDVNRFFPKARYLQYYGKRGASTGQGEIKRVQYDPLFSLNHTCAMYRANVNRLFRKTWCTTKRMDRLRAHLILYADFHNRRLFQA